MRFPVATALFLSVGLPLCASAQGHAKHTVAYARPVAVRVTLSDMAPADEYFGRFKMSILEIRNRLDAMDRRLDEDMLRPGTIQELDNLRDAILDWKHKYPHDPWLPRSLERLAREYHRAGA
jgi:hypothetical protein